MSGYLEKGIQTPMAQGRSYPGKGIFLLFEARRFRGFPLNYLLDLSAHKF
jgi:hypothetical protein